MNTLHDRYINDAKVIASSRILTDAPSQMHDIMMHYEQLADVIGSISANAEHEGKTVLAHQAKELSHRLDDIADGIRGAIRSIDASSLTDDINDL